MRSREIGIEPLPAMYPPSRLVAASNLKSLFFGSSAPNWEIGLLFNSFDKLTLVVPAQVSNLIEEERIFIGFFEKTIRILIGTGEAPRDVPKKFGPQEFGRVLATSYGGPTLDRDSFFGRGYCCVSNSASVVFPSPPLA